MRSLEENERILRSVLAEDLTPATSHPGYEVLQGRYLLNGHINRIIRSYAKVATHLPETASICVLGASPLEGFLLRRLLPKCSCTLFGSPEHLVYDSACQYQFLRALPERPYQTIITSRRHNIETRLPVDSQSYDCVVCFEALEHLRQDPLSVVVEAHRALKTDGILFLSTPNLNSARSIHRALSWENPMFFPSFGPPPSGIIHAHEYSIVELLVLLQRGGFVVDNLETFNHKSGPHFDHDNAYRSKALLPTEVVSRWGLNSPQREIIETALANHPLRGDYIFVCAAPSREPNREPFAPLYHLPT